MTPGTEAHQAFLSFTISQSLLRFMSTELVMPSNHLTLCHPLLLLLIFPSFPCGSDGRVCLQCRRTGFEPWVQKIPWRRKWQPTPVLLPGTSHGQRSLAGTVHGFAKSRTRLSDFTFTFPASGSFPKSRLFTSGGQSIGASASASVLPRTARVDYLQD